MDHPRPRILAVVSCLFVLSAIGRDVWAQTWTGLASPDNNWTTVGNWDTGVPGSGSTATFNSAGNGNTNISLGGGTQPITSIVFDTANAAASTLGALGSGDTYSFASGGGIQLTSTVTNSQTINAAIQTAGTLTITNNATTAGLTVAGAVTLGGNVTFTRTIGGGNITSGVSLTGPITFSSVASPTITNDLVYTQTLTLGSAVAPSTITLGGSHLMINQNNFNQSATIINDAIVGTGSLTIASPNLVTLAGQNTYSGGTTLNGSNNGSAASVLVGSSSNGPPATFTAGPFGTGPITINNSNNSSTTIQPINQSQTIANAVTVNSPVTFDGTSVTLTGTFTIGATVLSDMPLTNSGGPFSTLTLAGNVFLSNSATTGHTLEIAGDGNTVINGVIANYNGTGQPGRLWVVGTGIDGFGAPFTQVTGANTYSGGTTVFNSGRLLVDNTTGSGTGAGPVSVTSNFDGPGTLGGSGTITGTVTVSSTTATSQGGTIAPGDTTSGSAATLHVGSMVWNRYGQYVFDYSATDPTIGTGVNDFIFGTGALDLSNLNAANPFTLSFNKLPSGSLAMPETYSIATLLGGITGAGGVAGTPFADGTDVTDLFAININNASAIINNASAIATIVGPSGGPQSLEVTITPVPEPGSFLLLAAASAGFGLRRRWRRGGAVQRSFGAVLSRHLR